MATLVPPPVSQATSYGGLLVYAFLAGFAGNAFSVGIAWSSAWFPRSRQGFAHAVFGAGNVGASVQLLMSTARYRSCPGAAAGASPTLRTST